jgi:hypothetical protein
MRLYISQADRERIWCPVSSYDLKTSFRKRRKLELATQFANIYNKIYIKQNDM